MILSFKPQFKQPILTGTKIHTIREDAHNRWKPGMKIHMSTGVRTKNYDCFMESECVSVQEIFIKYLQFKYFKQCVIKIEGEFIGDIIFNDDGIDYSSELDPLFAQDGFSYPEEFLEWFNTDFKGKIIHWTDFRY